MVVWKGAEIPWAQPPDHARLIGSKPPRGDVQVWRGGKVLLYLIPSATAFEDGWDRAHLEQVDAIALGRVVAVFVARQLGEALSPRIEFGLCHRWLKLERHVRWNCDAETRSFVVSRLFSQDAAYFGLQRCGQERVFDTVAGEGDEVIPGRRQRMQGNQVRPGSPFCSSLVLLRWGALLRVGCYAALGLGCACDEDPLPLVALALSPAGGAFVAKGSLVRALRRPY